MNHGFLEHNPTRLRYFQPIVPDSSRILLSLQNITNLNNISKNNKRNVRDENHCVNKSMPPLCIIAKAHFFTTDMNTSLSLSWLISRCEMNYSENTIKKWNEKERRKRVSSELGIYHREYSSHLFSTSSYYPTQPTIHVVK